MAEVEAPEALLRAEFHGQTAQIPWHDLQPHYARGSVIEVAQGVDLVEVALQLKQDNTTAFQHWIDQGQVAVVSDEHALQYYETNPVLWAVVVPPWILVQLP
jgi:hypothetical protein